MWPYWKKEPDYTIPKSQVALIPGWVELAVQEDDERQVLADWLTDWDEGLAELVRDRWNLTALANLLSWGGYRAREAVAAVKSRMRYTAQWLSTMRLINHHQPEVDELDELCGLISRLEEMAFDQGQFSAIYPQKNTLLRVLRSRKHCERLCWACLSGYGVPADILAQSNVIRENFLQVFSSPWLASK